VAIVFEELQDNPGTPGTNVPYLVGVQKAVIRGREFGRHEVSLEQ
jgi:hypothetical protein